ncbi:MAG: hypothetical protein AMXMBFR53_07840 [Gemmatimonadota bacterium]
MTAHDAPRRRSTLIILSLSALMLGSLGLVLLFAPEETSSALGWGGGVAAPSLAAGGLLALAVLDWTGRGALFGGVYGRPIVLANLVLALTGGLALLRTQASTTDAPAAGWIPVAVLLLHGVGFTFILLGRVGGPGGR